MAAGGRLVQPEPLGGAGRLGGERVWLEAGRGFRRGRDQLITGRYEPELVAGRAARVWARAAETIAARIYGPHFEDLARRWCLEHAEDETLGGPPGSVRPTEVPCPEHKDRHELDIVVANDPSGGLITAIGEANAASTAMEVRELRRLEHLRGLLPSARVDQPPKLLLFGRWGFSPELGAEAATRPDVELIGLERLYRGS